VQNEEGKFNRHCFSSFVLMIMSFLGPAAVFRSENAYSIVRRFEGKEMLGWGERRSKGRHGGLPLQISIGVDGGV